MREGLSRLPDYLDEVGKESEGGQKYPKTVEFEKCDCVGFKKQWLPLV